MIKLLFTPAGDVDTALANLIKVGLVARKIGTEIEVEHGDFLALESILVGYRPPKTAEELAAIARKANAVSEARLATELKALTPAQAVAYIDSNVTNIASAKAVLKIMARMLIAMRDEVWPNLQDE